MAGNMVSDNKFVLAVVTLELLASGKWLVTLRLDNFLV